MSQKERTKRYKSEGAGAGMVRVEVLVPPVGRSRILIEAKKLRDNARLESAFSEKLTPEAIALFDEALTRYQTRCFWNTRPPKTKDGLEVAVHQLQAYGDLEAWRLAARIVGVLKNAD